MPELALPTLWQSEVQQQVYRQLLQAMAYPGRIAELRSIIADESAMGAVIATMVDPAVQLCDPQGLLGEEFLRFSHACLAPPEAADWLVLDGENPVPQALAPAIGSLEEPERSATLVIQVEALGDPAPTLGILRGPGLKTDLALKARGFHPSWLSARAQWCAKFPQGVDCILCAGQSMLALPRTTLITLSGGQ